MKTSEKILLYFVVFGFFVLFLLHFSKIDMVSLNLNSLFSILGLTITSISFLVACYFLVAAVSIYSKTKEFDLLKSQIQEAVTNFKKEYAIICTLSSDSEARLKNSLKEIASLMDNFISDQIRITDEQSMSTRLSEELKYYFEARKKSLYRERSIVALRYSLIDDERRLNLVREFARYANRYDVELLEQVEKNEKESIEVRDMAKFIRQNVIKNEFHLLILIGRCG